MIEPKETGPGEARGVRNSTLVRAHKQFLARANGKEWRRFFVRKLTGMYVPLDQER
jgi:hypothetical protein